MPAQHHREVDAAAALLQVVQTTDLVDADRGARVHEGTAVDVFEDDRLDGPSQRLRRRQRAQGANSWLAHSRGATPAREIWTAAHIVFATSTTRRGSDRRPVRSKAAGSPAVRAEQVRGA